VLLTWAAWLSQNTTCALESTSGPMWVGIDTEAPRIEQARLAFKQARDNGTINDTLSMRISFVCGNALDMDTLWLSECTVLFLYLIPRGLKRIQYLLERYRSENINGTLKPLRIISYMSPLPGVPVTRQEWIQVPHQPGAAWPLYYYEMK
jgi:hypothetical protein